MVINGWLTSLSFHVNRPSHSWDKATSNFGLENCRSRSWVGQRARSYGRLSILLICFLFISHQSDQQFLRTISKFDLEKFTIKVMSEVKGQGHIVYPVSNPCTSFLFHINRINHYWYMFKVVWPWKKTHIQIIKTKFGKYFLVKFLQNLAR